MSNQHRQFYSFPFKLQNLTFEMTLLLFILRINNITYLCYYAMRILAYQDIYTITV